MPAASHFLNILDASGQPVLGESDGQQLYGEAAQHVGDIDVTGWDWDVSDHSANPASAAAKPTGRAGAAAPAPAAAATGDIEQGVVPGTLTFRKVVDRSTTRLMSAMNSGEIMQSATFVILEEMLDSHDVRGGAFRLNVVLDKPVVVGYSLSGSASDFRVELDETWELSYSKITFAYESAKVYADFDRKPGSSTGRKAETDRDFLAVLKKLGIQPEQKRKGRG